MGCPELWALSPVCPEPCSSSRDLISTVLQKLPQCPAINWKAVGGSGGQWGRTRGVYGNPQAIKGSMMCCSAPPETPAGLPLPAGARCGAVSLPLGLLPPCLHSPQIDLTKGKY